MSDTPQTEMPRPPSDTVQIAIRVQSDWLERADKLIPVVARQGVAATRTDVFRAAIAKGFEAFEAEAREEARRAERIAARRLDRARSLARISGVPRLTVDYDPKAEELVISDGKFTKRTSYATEDEEVLCNWPGAKLDWNDDGEIWNVDSGEGIDANGISFKQRVLRKR